MLSEIELAEQIDISKSYIRLLIAVVNQAHHDSIDKRKDKVMMQDARAFLEWARSDLSAYLIGDDVPCRKNKVGRKLSL